MFITGAGTSLTTTGDGVPEYPGAGGGAGAGLGAGIGAGAGAGAGGGLAQATEPSRSMTSISPVINLFIRASFYSNYTIL